MKITNFILFLLISYSAFSQASIKPSELIHKAKIEQEIFQNVNLMENSRSLQTTDAQRFRLEETLANGILFQTKFSEQEPNKAIRLSLKDENGKSIELELVEVDIVAADFKLTYSNQEPAHSQLGVFYHGIVSGVEGSIAAISVFDKEIRGLISTPKEGNRVIGRLKGENPDNWHVLYLEKDLLLRNEFSCETNENNLPTTSQTVKKNIQKKVNSNIKCVKIYLEGDYGLFSELGDETDVFLFGMFNEVAMLYANEQVKIVISEMFIWKEDDPYDICFNCLGPLSQFQNYRTSFNGDYAQLVTPLRYLVGEAGGRTTPCNPLIEERMSYIGIQQMVNYNPVPLYSWSVNASAHEFGHLMGSPHTFECAWNGNNTAIDGCNSNTIACDVDGVTVIAPIPADGGTIMSYCHDNPVGTNLSLGFGQQPGDLIRNTIYEATCLEECVFEEECEAPTGLICFIDDLGHVSLVWNYEDPTFEYEVIIVEDDTNCGCPPDPKSPPVSKPFTVKTNSFNLKEYRIGTCFSWQVKRICELGLESDFSSRECHGGDNNACISFGIFGKIGLSDEQITKVYPNPSTFDEVNIEFSGKDETLLGIEVYTVDGKLVKAFDDLDKGSQYLKQTWQVDSHLENGVYLIRFITNERFVHKKFLLFR